MATVDLPLPSKLQAAHHFICHSNKTFEELQLDSVDRKDFGLTYHWSESK